MKYLIKKLIVVLGFTIVTAGPAFAKKPESPGKSESQKTNPDAQYDSESYFNDYRRTLINDYYSESRKSGKCPPGLAKKNNGCQPPGQIKKWRIGETFPRDMTYYDLSSVLLNELGRTPEGAKVLQVGTELLLISIATGVILDVFDFQK